MRAAVADAVAAILAVDAWLCFLPGHSSISGVFFHVPDGAPLAGVWPAVLAVGILLRVRPLTAAAVALAVWNCAEYYALLGAGRIEGFPVPFSALVAVGLAPALFAARAPLPATAIAAAALVPLHLFSFGVTDYRRPADAIVVFGAKAHPDGRASLALEDRTLTGIRLWREGWAPALVFSGADNEPDVMRRIALEQGVPDSAIVLDRAGVNTEATLRNAARRFGRLVAVSHYYHNARIKMLAGRLGAACVTVPARMTRRLAREPYFVLRECAAFVAYYLFVH